MLSRLKTKWLTKTVGFTFGLVAACLLVNGSVFAVGLTAPDGERLQPILDSHHPRGLYEAPVDREIQNALSAEPVWRDFLDRYGDAWKVRWSVAGGTPNMVWGEGIPLLDSGEDDPVVVERISRDFIEQNSELFAVQSSELELNAKSGRFGRDGELWFVHFDRVIDGIPVYGSDIFLRYKFGRLLQFGSVSFPDMAIPREPRIESEEALEKCLADCDFNREVDRIETSGELLYFPVQQRIGGACDYHLVYRIRIRQPDAPHYWHYYIDALDGRLVARWDHVFYETSGTVSGSVYPRIVIDPVTLVPLENIQVDISGGSPVFTDANGDYYSTVSGTQTVSAALIGPYINVNNQAGADAAVERTGAGNDLDLTFSLMNSSISERSCYNSLNTIRNLAMEWITPSWFDSRLTARVNINDTCNAYWDGLTVNFYQAGGGCNNTGELADVVYHEWGHGLDDNIGGIFSGASSEGWGDICAMMVTGDCLISPYFHTNGNPVRDVCVDYHYPEDVGEVHYEGQIIGSTNYDLLVYLQTTLGDTAGMEKLRELFWLHFHTSEHYLNDYDAYLVIDDDDGNLNNYTPNFNEINLAFSEHGLTERVIPSGVIFDHTPLTDTPDTVNPYETTAFITSLTDTLDSGALEIRYRVDGGGFMAVPMTSTGTADEYQGFIPAQGVGALVEYYLYGEDLEGPGTLPHNAPVSVFEFLVGFENIFFDDMESGENGWTHQQMATQDDWMFGSPGPNGYDPSSAYSGTSIWGNDLAPSGWNGDYASDVHNALRSPSIDCSGYNDVHLRYMRWLTVEEATYDQATIYVNGTQVWQNDQSGNHLDTDWTAHTIDISALANDNPSVVVEYHMESDGGLEFGGWNIDDVKLIGTSSLPPSDTISVELDAIPVSGQVPFNTQMSVVFRNLIGDERRVAGQINLTTGNGSLFENWRSGWTTLDGAETFSTIWQQHIPSVTTVIGNNVFELIGEDVTPAPFNQPPYAPSGDTDTDVLTVSAVN